MRNIRRFRWFRRFDTARNNNVLHCKIIIRSSSAQLDLLRKQLYAELRALDIPIVWIRTFCENFNLISQTVITVKCTAARQAELSALMSRLALHHHVHDVQIEAAPLHVASMQKTESRKRLVA